MRNKILKLGIPFDVSLVVFGSSCVFHSYLSLYVSSCYIFDMPPTMVKFSDVMPTRGLITSLCVSVIMVSVLSDFPCVV